MVRSSHVWIFRGNEVTEIEHVFEILALMHIQTMKAQMSLCKHANSIDPEETALLRAVWSGSILLAIEGTIIKQTGPRSAVGNVSGYRCVSDCRSRDPEFNPGPIPYFRGDWSWNNFYGHSPPFRWFIQEGLLSVTSESMCTNYWLTACSSLPRKKCG